MDFSPLSSFCILPFPLFSRCSLCFQLQLPLLARLGDAVRAGKQPGTRGGGVDADRRACGLLGEDQCCLDCVLGLWWKGKVGGGCCGGERVGGGVLTSEEGLFPLEEGVGFSGEAGVFLCEVGGEEGYFLLRVIAAATAAWYWCYGGCGYDVVRVGGGGVCVEKRRCGGCLGEGESLLPLQTGSSWGCVHFGLGECLRWNANGR